MTKPKSTEPFIPVGERQMIMPDMFVIKPHDKLALPAIRAWIGEAYMEGVNKEKILKAVEHYNAVLEWQQANPTKVKVPD